MKKNIYMVRLLKRDIKRLLLTFMVSFLFLTLSFYSVTAGNDLMQSTGVSLNEGSVAGGEFAMVAESDPLPTGVQEQQARQIRGKVTDINGDPIPGATVLVKGTTVGTISDANGDFSLQIPDRAQTLVISFVGFRSMELAIGTRDSFGITLEEETIGIGEVVAVGYGVQKKESIVGAISQTTNEKLRQTGNVSDLKQALTGQLPGVVTITSSGEPGGTTTGESATAIFIRGRNTWNGGQPLILVDGVERSMENLDVSEVENISVLKDASATAVFGVKGANGVILITTKRGSEGKPQLSFSYNATGLLVSKLPSKLDSYSALKLKNEIVEREVVLNEPSWVDYTPEEIVERYKLPQTPENAIVYPNVDWIDAMFKDWSVSHRAALNIRGGTNFVNYFGSLTYLHEGDMFEDYDNLKTYDPNYNFDRFNFRSNLDFKMTKSTTLKINLAGYFSQKNTNNSYTTQTSGTNRMAWSSAYFMPPDVFIPQYDDGRWGASFSLPPEQLVNPIALIYNTGLITRRTTELNADFAIEQDLDFITEGLSSRGAIFYDNSIQSAQNLADVSNSVIPTTTASPPAKIVYPERYKGPGQDPSEYIENFPTAGGYVFDWFLLPWSIGQETVATIDYTSTIPVERRLMYQLQVNYDRKFDKHNVGALGLFKREEYANGSMFKNFREDWVFRTTYDYDTRYLLEVNGAYNGSEKFGPGYRFDFFPSVAVGWYLSNEKFFNVDWIDRLKLRYSIGWVGDDTGSGGRWLYSSQFAYGGFTRMNANPNEESPYKRYRESIVGNPDIHWEKARKQNWGLEFGLLKNLFSVTYDYFIENRWDIMLAGTSRASIPPYFGATPPSANIGRVKSRGQEIEIKFDKRTNYGFHYWANLGISHAINEITERDDPELLSPYLKQAGYQIGQQRSMIRAGFYNNWDEIYASVPTETNDMAKLPGYYNLIDFNADGVIKSTDDTAPYGYSEVPQNTFNTTLGADFKGFSLMVQFYGVNNVTRYIPLRNFYSYQLVLFDHALDYWSKENQDASSFLPRWKTQGQNIGNYYYYDGSYLRLKTAEIAYTFQNKLTEKLGLSSLRFFFNGNNLFFWSKLPDDRESAWQGGGADEGAYPTPRRFNLGFDVTF